jgi:hypothetical protein
MQRLEKEKYKSTYIDCKAGATIPSPGHVELLYSHKFWCTDLNMKMDGKIEGVLECVICDVSQDLCILAFAL